MTRLIPATSLAIAFTTIAFALCGATLGLFLCGLFAAGLLVAMLDDSSQPSMQRVLLAGCIVDGVSVVWLASVFLSSISLLQWAQAYLVLIAIASAVFALRLIRANATLVAITWVAWFVAPVVLAQAMLCSHGAWLASAITRYHPLFALNRIFIEQGAWTSSGIAYRLLAPLGQDVAYSLPESIWPCAVCHFIVTVVGAVSAWGCAKLHRTAIAPC